MKSYRLPIISGIILLCCCFSIGLSAQHTLHIYYTNDMHSRIESYDVASADTAFAGRGGMIRVAKAANEFRKTQPDMLLFDSGDFSQGTPFYNLFQGELEIKMMNVAGYNACTIGNHEFDLGMENLVRLVQLAKFPFVCANYHFEGSMLEGLVKPYTIIERDGLKIGVFGLSPQLKGLVSDANCKGVTYEEPYDIANSVAAELKAKGCEVVICLSHLGYDGKPDAVNDVNLVKRTRGIDIVLGGHSHTLLRKPVMIPNLDGKEVIVTQAGTGGVSLGHLDVKISN